MPEENETRTNDGARLLRGEPYTLDEFVAAVNACPDNWMQLRPAFSRPDDVRDYILDRFGVHAAAMITVGMGLGLTMAEARRDG